MFKRVYRRRSSWVISFLLLGALLFIKCTNNQDGKGMSITHRVQYDQFAGSRTCASCHRNIYDAHIRTAHFHTSELSDEKNIKGSFEEGKNKFGFNPAEYVAMEKRKGRFYQVQYFRNVEKTAQPFDITVGSGKRGQTYLYWNDNKLLQLPISYFTSFDQWANSPGYSNRVVYNRPITSRCLECHGTYFQQTAGGENQADEFSKTDIIYGVDCEKCHGPGARHVEFHQKNTGEKTGKFIINPDKLTRQQNLDMCRLCHGGRLPKLKPSFSFLPGDSLSEFFAIPVGPPEPNGLDVHGNQYGLLASSKCFQGSQMTCTTCHSAHNNEEGMLSVFSSRCMNCHNREHNNFCKLKNQKKYDIAANCIDCHMPELRSRAIMFLMQGDDIPSPASMRAHYITVYPEATKKYLAGKK